MIQGIHINILSIGIFGNLVVKENVEADKVMLDTGMMERGRPMPVWGCQEEGFCLQENLSVALLATTKKQLCKPFEQSPAVILIYNTYVPESPTSLYHFQY